VLLTALIAGERAPFAALVVAAGLLARAWLAGRDTSFGAHRITRALAMTFGPGVVTAERHGAHQRQAGEDSEKATASAKCGEGLRESIEAIGVQKATSS
jgi:hypothetical protein